MPKSVTFTSPSGVISTLPGLTSRCTTPLRCANDERVGDLGGDARGFHRRSRRVRSWRTSRSVWPSTYSMTMNEVPSSSPQSYTATMLRVVQAARPPAPRGGTARRRWGRWRTRPTAPSPRRRGRAAGRARGRRRPCRRDRSRRRARSGSRRRVGRCHRQATGRPGGLDCTGSVAERGAWSICLAIGAATAPPVASLPTLPPCSTITDTAYRGASAGANATNHACGASPSTPVCAVPVLPAT